MDEYPREVRELLELAKDAHDPEDPEARARVRQRVAMAIAGGAAAAVAGKAIAQGSVKAGVFSSLTAKVTAASVAVVTAGSIAATQLEFTPQKQTASQEQSSHAREQNRAKPAAPELTTPEPTAETNAADPAPQAKGPDLEPVVTSADSLDVKREAHDGVRKVARAHSEKKPALSREVEPQATAPSPSDSLRAEMALLKASSDALSAGDSTRALSLLDRYRAEFTEPMLRAEHDGLRLIARCQRGEESARSEAKRLLKRSKTSVLATRITSACKLEGAK